MAVTQSVNCAEMYVIVREECDLGNEQSIDNHQNELYDIGAQMQAVYG